MTYFRTGGHYHRLQKLNCRVRNGNECFLQDVFTGNWLRGGVPPASTRIVVEISTDGSGREHPTLQEVGVLHAFIV